MSAKKFPFFFRLIFGFSGMIFLGFGVLGIFVPVLPTTPFLLVAVFLLMHSNKKIYEWLINHPVIGKPVNDFKTRGGMTIKSKLRILLWIWIVLSLSAFIFTDTLWLRILILSIPAVKTILFFTVVKTVPDNKAEEESDLKSDKDTADEKNC